MAIRLRSERASENQDSHDLLAALLDAPPAPSHGGRRPIALRSTPELRRQALSGFRLRTWVDALLQHTERFLLVMALLVFGYWLVDGPVRDWLHEQQPTAGAPIAVAAGPAAPRRASPQPEQRLTSAVPLPYVTSDMAAAPPADDFLAPRQSTARAPVSAAPQPTRLAIPSIGVDTAVKEVFIVDNVWEVADYAAGYLHGTGLPGSGNTVLAGHAGLRGAVFRDLGALAVNDDVYLDAAGWRYRYRVRESKAVWPTQVEVLEPSTAPVLTLMTCTNWDTQRLVVVADLIESKPLPGL
jgi:sortase A